MTLPKFPEDPVLIELKVHPADSSLPFYLRIEKSNTRKENRKFEALLLYAKVMMSRLEDDE